MSFCLKSNTQQHRNVIVRIWLFDREVRWVPEKNPARKLPFHQQLHFHWYWSVLFMSLKSRIWPQPILIPEQEKSFSRQPHERGHQRPALEAAAADVSAEMSPVHSEIGSFRTRSFSGKSNTQQLSLASPAARSCTFVLLTSLISRIMPQSILVHFRCCCSVLVGHVAPSPSLPAPLGHITADIVITQ